MKIKIYWDSGFRNFFTISINSIFGDSDFVLELINVNKDPAIPKLEIDGENFLGNMSK